MRCLICLATVTALFLEFTPQSSRSAEPSRLPLIFQEDFEAGAMNWEAKDPGGWKIAKTKLGQVYSQYKKESDYKPPHRSPFHISLIKDVVVGDFELTVQVRSTHADYGHRDVCLFLGYQDPAHFYYVHLGKKTDDHANQVFIVDGKPRTKISHKTTSGTNWDDQWHTVRIVRQTKTGLIAVYFDNLRNPIMLAQDKTFLRGRIGVGSFDDTGDWDNLRLRGIRVQNK